MLAGDRIMTRKVAGVPEAELIVPFEVSGIEGAELRALGDIARHLAAEHPEVDEATIRAALVEGIDRTAGAKVQNYRLVLAERWARARLRAGERPDVATPPVNGAVGAPAASASGTVDAARTLVLAG